MTFAEAMKNAYKYQLCVDFYSNTVTTPNGCKFYWKYDETELSNFTDLMVEVVEYMQGIE